uniref:Uncharacterized protein n=1 Tax=Arundo donax TaxID=35708 RepID=A0A0A8Y514_ARUDO
MIQYFQVVSLQELSFFPCFFSPCVSCSFVYCTILLLFSEKLSCKLYSQKKKLYMTYAE